MKRIRGASEGALLLFLPLHACPPLPSALERSTAALLFAGLLFAGRVAPSCNLRVPCAMWWTRHRTALPRAGITSTQAELPCQTVSRPAAK